MPEHAQRQHRHAERAADRSSGRRRAASSRSGPGPVPALAGVRGTPMPFPAVTRIAAADQVVQRDLAGDIDAGNEALQATENYNATVSQNIGPYATKVSNLEMTEFNDLGERMAAGFRTWAENYYNKSQAYLFEADLASQHTNLNVNPNRFAILGIDTDENPDLDIVTQPYVNIGTQFAPHWQSQPSTNRAVEVKASTSDRYDSMDGLITNGVKQLRKREQTGRYQQLELQIHNDNGANHWPLTDHMFNTNYGGNFNNVTRVNWDARLTTRMTQMKNTNHIALPLIVKASQGGQEYSSVVV